MWRKRPRPHHSPPHRRTTRSQVSRLLLFDCVANRPTRAVPRRLWVVMGQQPTGRSIEGAYRKVGANGDSNPLR